MHSAGQSSICALRFCLQQSRHQFQQAPSSCLGSMVRGRVSQVDDMVNSNSILYSSGEHPDHVVVIKYVPYVADSKRAMDEYTSEIFMGGRNTIALHNTCEDSLLAAPIILDLAILTELLTRIEARSWRPLSASCPDILALNAHTVRHPWRSRHTSAECSACQDSARPSCRPVTERLQDE